MIVLMALTSLELSSNIVVGLGLLHGSADIEFSDLVRSTH